jgi:hypothetical protein
MQNITVAELKARMDAGEQLNLIDVREPHEYAEYNIGAQLIPLGRIMSMDVAELEGKKNYCTLPQRYAQHAGLYGAGANGLYQYQKCRRRRTGLAGTGEITGGGITEYGPAVPCKKTPVRLPACKTNLHYDIQFAKRCAACIN